MTICQSVREAEVRRWEPVASPWRYTFIGQSVLHFSVRFRNSSQACSVLELGRIISSKICTLVGMKCANTEQRGFILKSIAQHNGSRQLNGILATLCARSKA